MAKYLPICGKNSNNNATPIGATNDGKLKIAHLWESGLKTICNNQAIRDTSAHVFPSAGESWIDISEFAITSLRIKNDLNQPCTMRFYSDYGPATDAGSWLADKNGTAFAVIIPTGSTMIMLTPDDFPPLNYLRGLRIRVNCDTAPTSGTLSVYAMCKR